MSRKIKDLTGQRFGRLVAVEPTKERSPGGSVMWLCRCDCGSTLEVWQSNLLGGRSKSCGCQKKHML